MEQLVDNEDGLSGESLLRGIEKAFHHGREAGALGENSEEASEPPPERLGLKEFEVLPRPRWLGSFGGLEEDVEVGEVSEPGLREVRVSDDWTPLVQPCHRQQASDESREVRLRVEERAVVRGEKERKIRGGGHG